MSFQLTAQAAESVELRKLYIDLLMKCLTMWLWEARDGEQIQPFGNDLRSRARNFVKRTLGREVPPKRDAQTKRMLGRDWPQLAHTMIGWKRLDNLRMCLEDTLAKGVPGDFIETGVWRGGATILMRGVLKAYSVSDRRVFVADSFAGLPPPDPAKYPADKGSMHHEVTQLAISVEEVRRNFERYGLLDNQVCFLKGWFKDTLPTAPIQRLAVARLDGDMYESTMDALVALYPKLSVGGYLILDDYQSVAGCRMAAEDYRTAHGIKDAIERIDEDGVFWRRTC